MNKTNKKTFIITSLCLGLLLIPLFIKKVPRRHALAAGASLYLSPSQGTFYVDSTFNISIFVNTGGNDINAVKVDLKFDPRHLQITRPTSGKSFITLWVSQPTYSNIEGKASFQGGIPTPGINTSSGLVSTITFRAKAPGSTTLSILSSSKVLLNDGKGTNILTSMGQGRYSLVIPPPSALKVSSVTHADANEWYQNKNAILIWDKPENTTGFSWKLDRNPNTIPNNKVNGTKTSITYQDLKDGIWYFHIKAKSQYYWSEVSHYSFKIDTTAPASFTPQIEPAIKSGDTHRIISFLTTDRGSGIDHYEVKVVPIGSTAKLEDVFFVDASSPWTTPELSPGTYKVIVRAYDGAGNYKDNIVNIEVVLILFSFSKEGLRIKGLLISWWIIVPILLALLLILGYKLYFWWRRQIDISESLETQIKKAEDRLKGEKEGLQRRVVQEEKEVKSALKKAVGRLRKTKKNKKVPKRNSKINQKNLEEKERGGA